MDQDSERRTGNRTPRRRGEIPTPKKTKRGDAPAGRTAEPATAGLVRLQKFLSRGGVASRRAAEDLIREGHVSVDGRVVTEMGVSIDPATSVVKVDGRLVRAPEAFSYYVLDKPRHVVCTMSDPEGRATVRDLIPAEVGRVYPVGRLDYDAEGVLLLTDDGDLAHRLMHPRFGVERTYHAKVKGRVEDRTLERLRAGVYLADGPARAEDVRFLRRTSENSWITLTLREGRQHEVKRMCLAAGHPVQKLRRVSYAGVGLGGLQPGAMRRLTPAELAQLRRAVRGGGGRKPAR
jgi:23S rRNA pseudouridine2605 synthase